MNCPNADDAITTIAIAKDYLHFSAAHFTIFSEGERENLHGHNFQVRCEIQSPLGENGLCFDYNLVKSRLEALCEGLDEQVLMPGRSPYLSIEPEGDYQVVVFGTERIPFLPRDLRVLPIANVTIEALSQWFLVQLRQDKKILDLPIRSFSVGIASGPNQWADSQWVNK
jgi:6-pyruvoyltetrahydropterin/6-carboxytetrahydropterin synthase